MQWAPIKAALATAAALTGIRPGMIAWKDQPQAGTWGFGARLTMQAKGLRGLGVDYEELQDNDDDANQTVTVVGQRLFNWEIRCEIQNSDPTVSPLFYLDRLRARLSRQTTVDDILQPAGLSVVEILPTQPLPNVKDSRVIATYVMEVVIGCAENDVDDTAEAGDFINSVNIASNKLKAPDGTDAPQQIVETIEGPT